MAYVYFKITYSKEVKVLLEVIKNRFEAKVERIVQFLSQVDGDFSLKTFLKILMLILFKVGKVLLILHIFNQIKTSIYA